MKRLFITGGFITLLLYGAAVLASSLPLISEAPYQTSDSTRTKSTGKTYKDKSAKGTQDGTWQHDSTGRKGPHMHKDSIR
jgi:hypothetical protein